MSTSSAPSVAVEIKQARPFRSRRQEAVIALQRTQGRIEEQFRRIIEPAGITLQQYNVLRILRGAGASGLPTLGIAERMIDRAPGVTRLLDRLQAQDLVRRVRGEDRRQVLCHITPKGLELLASLDAEVDAADESVFSALTQNEVGALIHLLDRVRASLR